MIVVGIGLCLLSVLSVIMSIVSDISDNIVCAISSLMGTIFGCGVFIILKCCGVLG